MNFQSCTSKLFGFKNVLLVALNTYITQKFCAEPEVLSPQNIMNPHLYLFDKTEYARSIGPTYSQVFGKNSNLSNLVPTFFHSYKNSKYGYLHLLYVIACNHFFIYLHEELKCLARLLDYFHIDGSSKEYHCTKNEVFH